jgi:hypothetical protein
VLISFVLEDPLGTNDILLCRTGNQGPNIISGELMELFIAWQIPSLHLEVLHQFSWALFVQGSSCRRLD